MSSRLRRRFSVLPCLILIAALLPLAASAQAQLPASAAPPATGAGAGMGAAGPAMAGTIYGGDTIRVLVVGDPLLSGEYQVDANGGITLPMAGMMRISGMTTDQAAAAITRTLKEKQILRKPQVSVYIVAQESPRAFTVVGAVNAPGQYPLQTSTTLLQAVARARDPVDGARAHAVEVTRTERNGQVQKRVYDLKRADAATAEIRPGDYIYVPYPKRRPDTLGIISTVTGLYFLIKSL